MAEEMITKERLEYTIDVLAAMTVEEIAEDIGKEEMVADYYNQLNKGWDNDESNNGDYKESKKDNCA